MGKEPPTPYPDAVEYDREAHPGQGRPLTQWVGQLSVPSLHQLILVKQLGGQGQNGGMVSVVVN